MAYINSLVQTIQDGLNREALGDSSSRTVVTEAVDDLKAQVDAPWDILWETRFEILNSICKRLAIETGILHAIVTRDGNPITSSELAEKTNLDKQFIERLIRVLTARRIISEVDVCTYAANDVTRLLDTPGSIAAEKYFFDFLFPIGANLIKCVKDGGIHQFPTKDQKGPFEFTFGAPIFDFLEANKEYKVVFDNLMSGRREGTEVKWFHTYPVASELASIRSNSQSETARSHNEVESNGDPDPVLLVDIAGGRGHDIYAFATEFPDLPGRLILEDLPSTFANVDSARLDMLRSAGIEMLQYDFFTPQPIHGARLYFMRDICHDWPDAECKRFLGNVAKVMTKGYSKLLLDEHVIDDVNANHRAAASDMLMMLVLTGIERTRSQWKELLGSVGLKIVKIWPNRRGQQSVIESELM
ncbi:hypothetical protein UA08_06502 [Talaromyces atroroseus]|uniref:O-methyltransferase C-terminal domain-containing protein n=1 Tax=Talaromyces atroroseus TaxID=1441469 RepID=A0A225AWX3_TALAT|nr:hypothetical protein UA08_06502 [Talaromyces atroroseus]OKL57997.1 hypothetical protein UA08_06502 [Talaromyces atroroseus]